MLLAPAKKPGQVLQVLVSLAPGFGGFFSHLLWLGGVGEAGGFPVFDKKVEKRGSGGTHTYRPLSDTWKENREIQFE